MQKNNFKYLLIFCCFFGCKKPFKDKITIVKSWKIDFESPCDLPRTKGDAAKGNYFTKADKNNTYSPCLTFILPDSLKRRFVRVCVNFDGRMNGRRFGQSLVIALQKKETLFLWETIEVNDHTFSKNKWININDSIQFYYDIPSNEEVELRLFGFSPYKKSVLDIDNMNVTVKEVETVSVLN